MPRRRRQRNDITASENENTKLYIVPHTNSSSTYQRSQRRARQQAAAAGKGTGTAGTGQQPVAVTRHPQHHLAGMTPRHQLHLHRHTNQTSPSASSFTSSSSLSSSESSAASFPASNTDGRAATGIASSNDLGRLHHSSFRRHTRSHNRQYHHEPDARLSFTPTTNSHHRTLPPTNNSGGEFAMQCALEHRDLLLVKARAAIENLQTDNAMLRARRALGSHTKNKPRTALGSQAPSLATSFAEAAPRNPPTTRDHPPGAAASNNTPFAAAPRTPGRGPQTLAPHDAAGAPIAIPANAIPAQQTATIMITQAECNRLLEDAKRQHDAEHEHKLTLARREGERDLATLADELERARAENKHVSMQLQATKELLKEAEAQTLESAKQADEVATQCRRAEEERDQARREEARLRATVDAAEQKARNSLAIATAARNDVEAHANRQSAAQTESSNLRQRVATLDAAATRADTERHAAVQEARNATIRQERAQTKWRAARAALEESRQEVATFKERLQLLEMDNASFRAQCDAHANTVSRNEFTEAMERALRAEAQVEFMTANADKEIHEASERIREACQSECAQELASARRDREDCLSRQAAAELEAETATKRLLESDSLVKELQNEKISSKEQYAERTLALRDALDRAQVAEGQVASLEQDLEQQIVSSTNIIDACKAEVRDFATLKANYEEMEAEMKQLRPSFEQAQRDIATISSQMQAREEELAETRLREARVIVERDTSFKEAHLFQERETKQREAFRELSERCDKAELQLAESRSRMSSLESEITERTRAQAAAEVQAERIREESQAIIVELRARADQCDDAQRHAAELKQRIESAEHASHAARAAEKEARVRQIAAAEHIKALQERIDTMQGSIVKMADHAEVGEHEYPVVVQRLRDALERNERVEGERMQLIERNTALELAMKDFNALNSQLSSMRMSADKYEAQSSELTRQVRDMQAALSEVTTARDRAALQARDANDQLGAADRRVADLVTEVKALNTLVTETHQALDTTREELRAREAHIAKLSPMAQKVRDELPSALSMLTKCRGDLAHAQKSIYKFQKATKRHEEAERSWNEERERATRLQAEHLEAQRSVAAMEEHIAGLQNENAAQLRTIDTLQSSVTTSQSESRAAQEAVRDAESRIKAAEIESRELGIREARSEARIRSLNAELDRVRAELSKSHRNQELESLSHESEMQRMRASMAEKAIHGDAVSSSGRGADLEAQIALMQGECNALRQEVQRRREEADDAMAQLNGGRGNRERLEKELLTVRRQCASDAEQALQDQSRAFAERMCAETSTRDRTEAQLRSMHTRALDEANGRLLEQSAEFNRLLDKEVAARTELQRKLEDKTRTLMRERSALCSELESLRTRAKHGNGSLFSREGKQMINEVVTLLCEMRLPSVASDSMIGAALMNEPPKNPPQLSSVSIDVEAQEREQMHRIITWVRDKVQAFGSVRRAFESTVAQVHHQWASQLEALVTEIQKRELDIAALERKARAYWEKRASSSKSGDDAVSSSPMSRGQRRGSLSARGSMSAMRAPRTPGHARLRSRDAHFSRLLASPIPFNYGN